MDNEQNENMGNIEATQVSTNPWAAAFAALEERSSGTSNASTEEASEDEANASGVPASNDDAVSTSDNGGMDSNNGGGQDSSDGSTDRSNEPGATESWSQQQIDEEIKSIENEITQKAINDVVALCKEKGIMTGENGELGASIYNPAIMSRDDDGNVTFINPDTGRPFTGDNPRKQAQEWCDQYNNELKDSFNKAAAQQAQHIRESRQAEIEVIKFMPTYNKLDDTRKALFEEIVSDYEVKDSKGNIIGYNCDLNKALGMVDRQISRLKTMVPVEEAQPTSPALDMHATGATIVNNNETPKSLEDAMRIVQERELNKLNKK